MEKDIMTTLEFKTVMEMVVLIIESSKIKKRHLKNQEPLHFKRK